MSEKIIDVVAMPPLSVLFFYTSFLWKIKTQLTWRTGCWGKWTSLSDAENVEFVEFDTYVGWQLYGKGDKLGYLSEVSRSAAVIGGLAGGMHTLVVFVAGAFLFFSLSALWLSYYRHFCAPRASSAEGKQDDPTKPKHERPLVLARDCHRWMFVMAVFYMLAGLWCFGIGCAGFYLIILHDFTDGLEVRLSAFGAVGLSSSPFYEHVIASIHTCLWEGVLHEGVTAKLDGLTTADRLNSTTIPEPALLD